MSGPNVRQGDGAGATMGFRGGKGRPGYPVPDEMRDDMEETETGMVEKAIDSIISKLAHTDGIVTLGETGEVVDRSTPLDLVVWDTVSGLVGEAGEKGEDLGFGFNEDGFPLQDKYEFQGLPIAIENKTGSIRKGKWTMFHDYGYVEGAIGSDGEPVDVYIGPDEYASFVYVVHQNKAPKFESYDEDKVMLGFTSEEDARDAYLKQYDDKNFYGGMSSMPLERFKEKVSSGGKITNESRLREGGAEMGGDPVPRENIGPTLKKFEDTFLSKIKYRSAKPIGSTGKKTQSGDLDIGLDTDLSLDDLLAAAKNAGLKAKVNKGLGTVHVAFPQYDKGGNEVGKVAQIDLMVGPEAWTQFQYYGPGEDESKYSGVHVRGIVNAIVSVITGHSVSPARGIFRKDDPDKKYNQDPKAAVALITKNSKEPWSLDDLKQPFERIWSKVQRSFGQEEIGKIRQYFLDFMKSTKRTVPTELGEAKSDEKTGAPKGIAHLEDLKPDEFLRFLEQYKDLPLKGGLEVSEKVDGSAQMSFGAKLGKLWTKSKNGPMRTKAEQYGDKPMFKSLRMAHAALEPLGPDIPDDVVFVSDVLYSRIPNSIEYGDNRVVVHGVNVGGKHLPDLESRKAVEDLRAQKLTDGSEPWHLEYKRVLDPNEVMVDVKEEYASIGEIYRELKALEPNRLKAVGKGPYKAALEKFKTVQVALKKKLVGQLRKQSSAYGPKGGDVEGLVFRDLETGALTKLVDKEYFTKLNNFLWHYRKLLDSGVQVGGQWQFGLMAKLKAAVADNVFGDPNAKQTTFVKKLREFGSGLEYPAEANTPEKKGDFLLSQYIKKNGLMKGDFITGLKKELLTARKEFDDLRKNWDSQKKKELSHPVKDDEGNVIKTVKMDPIIKSRTDDSFDGMKDFLDGVTTAIDGINGMKGELTKKTAVLKLMLGQNRFEKVMGGSEDEPQDEAVSEAVLRNDLKHPDQVLKAFSDLLAKRRLDVSSARKLGEGYNGVAYDIGGGKVLKVTGDHAEARAANHLKGKKLKHVAHIFDVFKFPTSGANTWYGVVEELMQQLSDNDKQRFNEAASFIRKMYNFTDLKNVHNVNNLWVLPWKDIKDRVTTNLADDPEDSGHAREAFETLEALGLPDVLEELGRNRIGYGDVHADNFMKRGNDLVVVDLGGNSDSPGKVPNVLEKVVHNVLEALSEAGADQVGVTIGRFQPFHKGHAAMVRDLAKKFDKVIVIVAGNKKDKDNPFSFDLRLEMMKMSLPDVMSKVEIHKAEFDGKNSGYIPGILSDIVKNKRSSVEAGTAVHVLVGQDRLAGIQQQMEHAKGLKDKGIELMFDPNLAVVQVLPDVKNDDEAERVSGTRAREAIAQDRKDVVGAMLDPHLVSNPAEFENIYSKLKAELGGPLPTKPAKVPKTKKVGEGIQEALGRVDERDIEDVLEKNAESLVGKGIRQDTLKKLGSGMDGVAYDAGGGKVLKVTTNEDEAKSSWKISKEAKNARHIVKIFDVFRFKPDTVPGGNVLYGVVTEILKKLSRQEAEEFNQISAFWLDPEVKTEVTPFLRKGDYDGLLNAIRGVVLKHEMTDNPIDIREAGNDPTANVRLPIAGQQKGTAFSPAKQPDQQVNNDPVAAQASVQQKMNILDKKYKRFGLPDMMRELKQLGIQFSDFHSDNVMKRGGEFVINDLGRSEGGLASQSIPQLEQRIIEAVISEIGAFTGIGGSTLGARGGSSSVSAFKNRVDPNSEELWQNQLSRLEIFGSGALPEDAGDQKEFELSGSESSAVPEIKFETWIPWSARTAQLFDKKPHSKAGRGELSFAMELEMRGIDSKLTGETASFDVEAGGKKFEVKELTNIRIEKTGIPMAKQTIDYFKKVVDALEISVQEIEEELQPTGDWLQPHGLSVPQLKAFIQVAKKAVDGTNMPMGLIGLTTRKGSVLPVNFKTVMDAIEKLIVGSEQKTRKGWAAFDNKEFLDQDVSASGARMIAKAMSKEFGIPFKKAIEATEAIIFEANFKEHGIRPSDINYESMQRKFLQTFDPSKVLGDIDNVVIVDRNKGFFIFDKSRVPEFLRPTGISKGTPGFSPNEKLRGGKAPRKPSSKPRTAGKKKAQEPVKEPTQQELPL